MNAQAHALTVIETAIVEYRPYAEQLAELQQRYQGVVFDVTTKIGMAEAKAARKEVKDVRLALEAERVRIKAPALERSRAIDADAKLIGNVILPLEAGIDDQIKAEEDRVARAKQAAEEAELGRQAALQAAFAQLQAMADLRVEDHTVEALQAALARVEAFDVDAHDEVNRAGVRFQQTLTANAIKALIDKRHAYDAEQVKLAAEREELEQLRREKAEREEAETRAASEQQAARDAELRQQREAEQEAQRLEQVRLAEEQAAERAIAAERQRVAAAEEAERKAAERREANRRHAGKINSAAAGALAQHAGLSEDDCRKVVEAIAKGLIPAVSITY